MAKSHNTTPAMPILSKAKERKSSVKTFLKEWIILFIPFKKVGKNYKIIFHNNHKIKDEN